MEKLFVIFALALIVQIPAGAQNSPPPVATVNSVDLNQYLGKWYEIAALPQSFEKQCVGNTTAEYANAEDGLISVVNTCDTAANGPSVATGRAKVVDTVSNAKLKVTFVNFLGWQFLFGGDYWILALGENYSYAVVGAPSRDSAWILSRTPLMTEDQLREAQNSLVQQGFDACKLITTVQAGGFQDRAPLCQFVPVK